MLLSVFLRLSKLNIEHLKIMYIKLFYSQKPLQIAMKLSVFNDVNQFQ